MAETPHFQDIDAPSDEYPGIEIPTIFADGVMNLANSPHVMKFYLFRLDPSAKDMQKAQARVCAQIVLPMNGFLNMVAFLERAVEGLRAQGIVTEEDISAARDGKTVT
jgi:hypothetical protein